VTHFPGSKGGSGVAQWLISLMPVHRVFVEAFYGRGVISATKRPAQFNLGMELDAMTRSQIQLHPRAQSDSATPPAFAILEGDALAWLPLLRVEPDWLIYCDPPYLGSSRSCSRRYYREEMLTTTAHDRLLSVLTALQGMVMLSGYRSDLYAARLAGWRLETFWTVNRRGKRVEECCWCNFGPPQSFHESTFAGANRTERQRIKRKAARWLSKFKSASPQERQAILAALSSSAAVPNCAGPGLGSQSQLPAPARAASSDCAGSPS
jgi:hypothetical protein